MNKKIILLFSLYLILAITLCVTSCKDDDDDKEPSTPTITSMSPTQGVAGDEITIVGTNFSTDIKGNFVQFNGVDVAEVLEATATQIKVPVPFQATTGKITITVDGEKATSAETFTVLMPAISDFSPKVGITGMTVVINGENFSPMKTLNHVKFNDINAEVISATTTQLEVEVPESVSTGKIKVNVGINSATTAEDFIVCEKQELAVMSATATEAAGNTINYSIVVINLGEGDIDLSDWYYQNYASIDNVYNGGDQGGGGAPMGTAVLHSGESTTLNSSVGGITPGTYHYFIINVNLYDEGSIDECSTDNNTLVVPIN